MNKRVFHIDQECFIIFVEELSSKKERFLRIGNTPVLKEFGENLTFVTLLSKLYPGDSYREVDIFRPKIDKRVIGLKEITKNFINFLDKNGVNTEKVKKTYAEVDGKWFTNDVKSEKDFLEKIEKNNGVKNHSFASFYNDGNIRVFNKSELIFDLEESLRNILDEKKEILKLSKFFIDFYKDSYKKSGIIYSNKSFFVFSENNFACITDSESWVKDAVRVGINPFDIDIIYITERVKPDSLWAKFFISYERKEKGVKLLSVERPAWEEIIPKQNVEFLNPMKKPVKHELGKIKLFFHKQKIIITYDDLILAFDDNENFLEKDTFIKGEYNENDKKIKFKLAVDAFGKDNLSLYSFNPCIFEKKFKRNDYIKNFWKSLNFDRKNFNNNTALNDDEYKSSIISSIKKDDFYNLLFLENVKRINVEGNKKATDEEIEEYQKALKKFNGEEINKNNLIIEQFLGVNGKAGKICMRDSLKQNDFAYFDKNVNPFLSFTKDQSKNEWVEKQGKFREKFKKNVKDDLAAEISKRYMEVIDTKQFHIEEQERLRRFLERVIIKENQRENYEKLKTSGSVNKNANNKNANEEVNKKNNKNKKYASFFERFGINKKVFIFSSIALLLLLLLLGTFFMFRKFNSDFNFEFNKNLIIKRIEQSANKKNKYRKATIPNRESSKFGFYMTMRDLLNLTNKVALDNGYHKIVYQNQKRYVKGKDPDLIFPGNKLKFPDKDIVLVEEKDTMWDLCEQFLINQLNIHEEKIVKIIKDVNNGKKDIKKSKEELVIIKSESYSEMLRDFVDYMLIQNDFREVEKLIKENGNKKRK